MLGLLIASSLLILCRTEGGEYDYQPSYYDDQQYGYDDQCNCNEICGGYEPEEWEFEYEEVPPCIINNCGVELDKCAYADSCVSGIEGVVSKCYADNEDPMQCMDELAKDTENNQFTQFCDGNEECGADLKSLGSCVINSANYGFCPEEVYKKLQLKSVAKTIKIRSRKQKRKVAALKSKSKRSRSRKARKIRGKRASKLRKSRRKLQEYENEDSYSSDYENPEYDYGCYCDCGEEEEEIPDCVIDNCGQQLFACGDSEDCAAGIEGVIATCYEDNDSPQECMDELIKESNGEQAIELCNGNEEAAGDLQALGDCVINSANYGFCSEDEYKKLKVKALVKATKKVRARKVASKQRKARSSRRARSARGQRRRQRKIRTQRVRPRSRVEAQRLAKSRRARASKKVRKSRRKLQSSEGGCCECTDASNEPYCNEECDNTICSYDPYCCNEDYGSWDWICAASAVQECNGDNEEEDEWDYYEPPTASAECCECTQSSDSPFCNDECDANICSYDPYCCNVQWDWICANSAKDECAASGNTFEGEETNPPPGDDESCCDCTSTADGVGCSANPECETIVCPLDSYCCNVNWDGICANGANNICNAVDYWSWEQTTNYNDYDDSWYQDSYDTYNDGTTGSCCDCTSDSDGPGCNTVCDNEVCPLDSYCCNNQWDWICANGANNICQGYDYFNSGGSTGYDSYQDSYDFNYGYSDEPYYNSEEYSYYTPSYNAYDSFNDYGPDSYYQPSYDTYDSYQTNYGYSDYQPYDSYNYGSFGDSFNNYYEPNSYDYSFYDSYNNYQPYDYSDNYDYGSYSYYSPSGEFTYSDEPYYNSEEYSYYDDYQYEYGYDDSCNCDEICYGQEPEDWEFEYDEVPPCIINNCGQQLDTCAASDSCIEGIEGIVSSCYADNEDPTQCMDGLVQDTENNGFTQLCDGNEECGADLQALGECVVNSANYGFCPEDEYKKLKLKSVLKTVKKRSRKLKRKSVAAKQKSKRSRKSQRSKKRGKRASKLRQSRRKLQDGSSDYYYNDYENPEYDYGCYCDCGDEEEEIPPCIIDNCGEQLYACGESEDCINGVEGVIQQCYEDNDTPQQCMDELMQEANGAQAIELCNGNEEAAGDLQALGTCVINSANYGFCSEDEYKKLKIKTLVKTTKKVRARKVASKQRKARSSQRARSLKARSQKQRQRKVRSQRSKRVRPRGRRAVAQRQRQRRVRSQRTSRRPRKLRRRKRQMKRQRN